ncbi:hypothetical protein AHAS_Ahas18G0194900 [Arachis hypogaea]
MMCQKLGCYNRPSSATHEAGSSKTKATKGKSPMTEEETPSSPPPRSTSRPLGRLAPSSRPSKGCQILLNHENISESLAYIDVGVNAYVFGKWDNHFRVSHQDVLVNICENISLMDGVTPTHRALSPSRTQLHRIIIHILLPQSGSYQRVSFYYSLILYAILNKIQISFAYLMIHHMFDCINSDKNVSLPYGIFFTCIFEYFAVDLSDETMKDKLSYLKGSGVVKQTKEKSTKAVKKLVLEKDEEESIFLPSTVGSSSSNKYLINGIIKDVLQEFINLLK